MVRWCLVILSLAALLSAASVSAEEKVLGHVSFSHRDQGKKVEFELKHAYAYAPRFDIRGFGKPEVVLVFATEPMDAGALGGWVNQNNGAHHQVVSQQNGALLTFAVMPGLELGQVGADTTGVVFGGQCESCTGAVTLEGGQLKGGWKTTMPIAVMSTDLVFDVQFSLPKPEMPALGEALPADGGEPGKAYLAYLKAIQDGDYQALQTLMPEGKAKDQWGYHDEGEDRSKAIRDSGDYKSAKVKRGHKSGDSALLVVDAERNSGGIVQMGIGMHFDGTRWRVREEIFDFVGTIFGE